MGRQFVTPSGTPGGRGAPTDDAAAERLYAEYSERLLAFCFRQLRSRAEAEDAVQVTFLCALRALRRGVVPEAESAWLHAIARNVCRWQQRTASRRPVSAEVEVESVALSTGDDEDIGSLSGLREALEALPERQRQALLLREWRGLSAHEIAEYLHLSPPATHALLTRARRSLAHALSAPQRAALGVASLVYELRSWLKAALGGASAKVAVATVAVVGTGVGGAVVVDQSMAGDRGSRSPATTAQPTPVDPVGNRVGATSRTTAVGSSADSSAATASGLRGAATRGSGTTLVSGRQPVPGPAQTIRGRTRPAAPAPAPTPPSPDTPEAGPRDGDPLLPPVLPPVDLPPLDLPPVDVPPVDVPPVDLPTDLIPPIGVPPVDVPPLDPPPPPVPSLPPLGR